MAPATEGPTRMTDAGLSLLHQAAQRFAPDSPEFRARLAPPPTSCGCRSGDRDIVVRQWPACHDLPMPGSRSRPWPGRTRRSEVFPDPLRQPDEA